MARRNPKKSKEILSEDVRSDLDAMDESALNKVVADASDAIATATKERDANQRYIAAKQAVADLSAGLKDVKKYQGAKISYSLKRLRELRGEGSEE